MKRFFFIAVLALAVVAFAKPLHPRMVMPSSDARIPAVTKDGVRIPSTDELNAIDTLVYYNWEQDSTSWSIVNLYDTPSYWHKDRRNHGSTGNVWACNDTINFPNGGYTNHTLNYLISPTLNLSATTNPVLAFKVSVCAEPPSTYNAYTGWDGGNVWYSTNGGTSWSVLPITATSGWGYNVTNAYSFGHEFGMNPDPGTANPIPEWGDSTGTWHVVRVPLTAAMRTAQFKFKFAFCSDPEYCSTQNPGLYGMLIDSVKLTDSTTTILYNDADANATPSDFTTQNVSSGANLWRRVQNTAVGHSTPFCMWIAESINAYRTALVSPAIYLAPGYRYWWQFNIKDDMQDTSATILKDYFEMNLKVGSSGAWSHQFIEFDRAATGGPSWIFYGPGSPAWRYSADTTINVNMDLTPFIRDTVWLEFVAIGDNGNTRTGTGLFIDDFTIVRSNQQDHDVGPTQLIVPYPNTVSFRTKGTAHVHNFGRAASTSIPFRWRTNDGSVVVTSPVITIANLDSAADTIVSLRTLTDTRGWTPAAAGTYAIDAFTSLVGDSVPGNDLINFVNTQLTNYADSVFVRASDYELGYDSRRIDGVRMIVASPNPIVKFTPLADSVIASAWDISAVRIQFNGINTQPTVLRAATVKIYTDNAGVPGTILRTIQIAVPRDSTLPVWYTTPVSPALRVTGNFWIGISRTVTSDTLSIVSHTAAAPFMVGHCALWNDTALSALNAAAYKIHAIVTAILDVKEVASALPGSFELYNAYPNPFNPTTEVKFALPIRSHVKVSVFNISGQEVAQLVNGELNAGTYKATVNGSRMASGIYFVKMNAGSFNASRKIVLVK